MPVGLDGNPDPIVTPARTAVMERALAHVLRRAAGRARSLVAIDGRSGSGKSTFADELAAALRRSGVRTLRSTTDSFHRPRRERLRRGPNSAQGYVDDSHQLEVIAEELLTPFAEGAAEVLVAAFHEPSDAPDRRVAIVTNDPTVLVFDGLFLQRSEFAARWDAVVYLSADRRLDRAWTTYLLADLPDDPVERATALDDRLERARWPRYRRGWARYVDAAGPASNATMVIDNDDLARPRVIHEQ